MKIVGIVYLIGILDVDVIVILKLVNIALLTNHIMLQPVFRMLLLQVKIRFFVKELLRQKQREGGTLFIDTLCEDENIFKDFIRCVLYKK